MLRCTFFTVSAALSMIGGTAIADVSPNDVWQDWQAAGQAMGQSLSGEIDEHAAILQIYDMTIKSEIFQSDYVSSIGVIPEVVMIDLGNGEVEITFPSEGVLMTSVQGNTELDIPPVETLSYFGYDGTIRASGSPGAIVYDIEPGGSINYYTDKIIEDGIVLAPAVSGVLTGISGLITNAIDDEGVATSTALAIESYRYFADGSVPDSFQMEFESIGGPLDIISATTYSQPTDTATALDWAALDAIATYSVGPSQFRLETNDGPQAVSVFAETQSGQLDLSIGDGTITYDTYSSGIELLVNGSAIPFPNVSLGINQASFGVAFPVVASDEAKPVALSMAVDALRLPDFAWMMLDPQGQLPHDPARFSIDLEGSVIPKVSIVDPTSLIGPDMMASPFEPLEFTLNELFLSLAGAEFIGTGAAGFDPDESNPMGMPATDATLSLSLTGGMAVLDTLAMGGLLPPQIVLSAKGMIGMFARPGDVPDSFISDIEMTKDGTITMNGLPLPF